MIPPSMPGPVICAICGNPIGDVESFHVGTVGQRYHLDCVRKRQALGSGPELADDTVTNPPAGDAGQPTTT